MISGVRWSFQGGSRMYSNVTQHFQSPSPTANSNVMRPIHYKDNLFVDSECGGFNRGSFIVHVVVCQINIIDSFKLTV